MSASTLIVGGGIAGLAAAWALARAGARGVELHEQDTQLAMHASSRNAAILRTPMPDPVLEAAALEGAQLLRTPPRDLGADSFVDANGVVLLGDPLHTPWLQRVVARPQTQALRADRLQALHPLVRSVAPTIQQSATSVEQAWLVPDEGGIRLGALLAALRSSLEHYGVQVHTRSTITHLEPGRGAYDTQRRFYPADRLVVATGAWAQPLAASAGSTLRFQPTRRHLLIAEAGRALDARWPVVWAEQAPFYARVVTRGLLLSSCDEVAVDAQHAPVDPRVLSTIVERAHARLHVPAQLAVRHAWSCLRTHGPNERFVVGPDPRVPDLWFLAGLGGHGITCALPTALMLAEWMTRGTSTHPLAAAFGPQR